MIRRKVDANVEEIVNAGIQNAKHWGSRSHCRSATLEIPRGEGICGKQYVDHLAT